MKIGYFADGPWSHKALNHILKNRDLQICFICIRYDSQDDVLVKMAGKLNIPLLKHQNVNSDEFIESLSGYNCDIFVSMSFNQIFRKRILSAAPRGIINCHAGLLPFYRGRNILNWALINDEKEFGVTVHHVDTGVDTGDIIVQRRVAIHESDDYASLLEKAYVVCADTLYEALVQIYTGTAGRISQSTVHMHGLYCGQRKPGDEIIDWRQPSRDVFNFIRAVCRPGPIATTFCEGMKISINKALFFPEAPHYIGIPGQVLSKTEAGYLIKTQDSYIEIQQIQMEKKIKVGDRLK